MSSPTPKRARFVAAALTALAGCAAAPAIPPQADWVNDPWAEPKSPMNGEWRNGDYVVQGYVGASSNEEFTRTEGGSVVVDGTIGTLPVIGGGAQLRLGGAGGLDLGLEVFIRHRLDLRDFHRFCERLIHVRQGRLITEQAHNRTVICLVHFPLLELALCHCAAKLPRKVRKFGAEFIKLFSI